MTSPELRDPDSSREVWARDSSRAATPAPAPPSAADPRLGELRQRIEQLDRDLVELIAERTDLARRVGEVKRELGLPVLDPAREAAVVRRAGSLAREAGLPDEDVRYLFWHLVGLCRRAQLEEE
jgi:chorismate mutase